MVANRFDHLAIFEPERVGKEWAGGPIVHVPVMMYSCASSSLTTNEVLAANAGASQNSAPTAVIADIIAAYPSHFLFARLAIHETIARSARADSAQSLAELDSATSERR